MYELIQAGPQSYYIDAPAKIGIYLANERDVYLIDSGNNKDAGKRVRKILDKQNWTLKGIINTHSHADHIGGNQYLQKQYGCDIFASGIEADFTRSPLLEPSFLYGGYAFHDLRHRFLMAEQSDARDISDPAFPGELEILPLPGHSFAMIGIRTPDHTLFLADCVSSPATLEKYKVIFIYDVGAYLSTLTMLESCTANIFVPSHTEAVTDLTALIKANREAVLAVGETVLELCRSGSSFEMVLQEIFTRYELTMTPEQYVLVGSSIRSYLAWLRDNEKLDFRFENNRMLWQTV